jgi:hypothetical protein
LKVLFIAGIVGCAAGLKALPADKPGPVSPGLVSPGLAPGPVRRERL